GPNFDASAFRSAEHQTNYGKRGNEKDHLNFVFVPNSAKECGCTHQQGPILRGSARRQKKKQQTDDNQTRGEHFATEHTKMKLHSTRKGKGKCRNTRKPPVANYCADEQPKRKHQSRCH